MPDQPAPRARRSSAEIAKLLNSVKAEDLSRLSDLTRQETVQPSASAKEGGLNPELKTYLTPDLWRKLNEDSTRRGLFNNALDRMQTLLYTISTYLPGDLVREKMKDPEVGLVNGNLLNGCLLFSDVSGFTALSERLATLGPKGAEHLTEVINRYFTEMIAILSRSNGTLVKFAGDATLVFFHEQQNGEHVRWAARAGLRMMRAMRKFADIPTPLGPVTITMKIGLSAGSFLAASVGSAKRMEYVLVGPTVSETLQAEGCTKPGDIVVNQQAASLLSATYEMTEVKTGFFLLRPKSEEKLDEYEITQTQRLRSRGSAVQWDASLEEIKSEIDEKLNQIKALTPYLASELVDRIIVHANQRQVQSEYRPTTVMFCNFTGPDTLLEMWGEAGAKRVTGILSDYFTAMNEIITRFGGIVSRIDPYTEGNKLLALFGAPVAHEDDAQRAISAALEMNNVLSKLNRDWAQNLSRHLPPGSKQNFVEHRIGITLGDTFAGQAGASTRREYTVMGDEVNLAARLMSTARPGQILISQPVFEVTNAYYIGSKLPPVQVKGKANPIEIWQVEGPREDTLLNRIESRQSLIGRSSELERGWQAIQNARAGKVSVLTLTGQAGMGKSHLADVLLKKALNDGWQVHAYQCRSYLSTESYSCWKGLLCSLAGITSIDHLLIQKEKLERLAAKFDLPADQSAALMRMMKLHEVRSSGESTLQSGKWNADFVASIVQKKEFSRRSRNSKFLQKLIEGTDKSTTKSDWPVDEKTIQQQQAALTSILTGISVQKPLMLFFEDVQWMDPDSKNCLEALSRDIFNRPLLFLLALRTQETDKKKNDNRIDLTPFSKIETRSMVAEILTAGLVDIIHEQSNGSPLFVEEISRWIKHTHSIDENRLKEILQTSDILQKLVLSRLESLPEGQREVARMASVIGVEFRNSEVKALLSTGTIDPITLYEYLNDLVKNGLITLSGYGVDKRYTFAQPIFRDILYTSLPFERRSELHRFMAKYLSQASDSRRLQGKIANFLEDEADPLQDSEKLAYHYEMSEQWLEAARQLLDIAENVAQTQNIVEDLCTQSLSLLKHYPSEKVSAIVGQEKARAHLALGNAALKRLDLAGAVAAHEAALVALSTEESPVQTVNVIAHLCMLLPSQGKIDTAEKHLAKALNIQPNDWKLRAISAWLTWRSGRDAKSQVEACCASLPETNTDATLRVRALMDELDGNFARAAETYQLANETHLAAMVWVQLGDQLLKQKRPVEAAEQYEQAAAVWQDTDFCGLALIRYRQAEIEWRARHGPQAVSLLKDALTLLEKSTPIMQIEPRACIQKALTRVNAKGYGEWKYWRWQPFGDLAHINFCFSLFHEVK